LVLFWRVRPLAGMLLLPYLAWVLFAAVLNWQFLQANPDAEGQDVSGAVSTVTFE
jgi:tryptophan-rich sensory protein